MDIELIHIKKRFANQPVFSDLNVTFAQGEISCLMGPSGIGKSTLLNMIMGLIRPDSGEIKGTEHIRIAAVFQEDRLVEHWDAIKNIKLVCDAKISEARIEAELDRVLLKDYQQKPVKKLSGGMRRRVVIVRALLSESDLVILDEPFRGLDKMLKDVVASYIKSMTENKTVIVVTHDHEDIELLNAGKVMLNG